MQIHNRVSLNQEIFLQENAIPFVWLESTHEQPQEMSPLRDFFLNCEV